MKNKRLLYTFLFCGLLALEICIALFVHDAFIRPYVGDSQQDFSRWPY